MYTDRCSVHSHPEPWWGWFRVYPLQPERERQLSGETKIAGYCRRWHCGCLPFLHCALWLFTCPASRPTDHFIRAMLVCTLILRASPPLQLNHRRSNRPVPARPARGWQQQHNRSVRAEPPSWPQHPSLGFATLGFSEIQPESFKSHGGWASEQLPDGQEGGGGRAAAGHVRRPDQTAAHLHGHHHRRLLCPRHRLDHRLHRLHLVSPRCLSCPLLSNSF